MPLFSLAGSPPDNLGITNAKLAPCPDSPNCVSSDATDDSHEIAPFKLEVPAPQAWTAARNAVAEMARTEIVTDEPDYLHAESTSRLMRYVDDLELHLREKDGLIAVRSASRVGYSDMGVNRKRVEALRETLREQGVIR